ncbi:Alanine racemase, catabolic [Ephemeroptericola cinctiostellae]|uniref:Alanine racemase n=1 Tax=Ephemeroptericola cinctiostellae TaxID=2268024 RepID=A0A345DBY7_9BURK|nr:alanine racemase [Ephemeroptericola cinctiostellae]AXF85875.1 Alanine racemase, catabolic [Ephemeroptericola cinctiostellae]
MPRPIIATIFTDAIAHNIKRAHQASGAKVWATIKANAYGHGIEHIFKGLQGADGLAMLDFAEAQLVRDLGWDKPVLMLEGGFEVADYKLAERLNLTMVIHCIEQIEWLEQAALSQPLNVYLKVNSGMNRVGFAPDAYVSIYRRVRALACVGEITCMTHFANADLENGIVEPMRRFGTATAELMAENPNLPRSCSNSAATLAHPEAHFDWVRPGIMTYGGSPFGDKGAAECGLEAAMALDSEIIAVQHIQAGESVGYGSKFTAIEDMTIGVVACGYADGYPRHAATGTPVLVDGVRTRLVGRVSMDMLMVDLNPVPAAKVGSPVQLWGKDIAIDDVARASETIGYELMCALALRVPVRVV